MTAARWTRICEQIDTGDPLKDIDCDEDELISYIFELRNRLELNEGVP